MFNFEYSKRKKLKNIYNKALIVIIGLAILIGTGYITSQYLETKRLTEISLKKEEAEKTEQTKEAARLLAIEQKNKNQLILIYLELILFKLYVKIILSQTVFGY